MNEAIEGTLFGVLDADPRALLYYEWRQRLESGYVVEAFGADVHRLAATRSADPAACLALLDRIERAPRHTGWSCDEPEIDGSSRASRHRPPPSSGAPTALPPIPARQRYSSNPDVPPPGTGLVRLNTTVAQNDSRSFGSARSGSLSQSPSGADELFDRIHGGWLGRCVGCALGKPLENGFVWTPQRIRAYLERAGAYPLVDYVPALLSPSKEFPLNPTWPISARGCIDGSPRDDDVDYTVLGLHLLERRGFGFTTSDVATAWLELLPFRQTYTAERAAYRNLINGLRPPATALHRNPYREWIGALIRADIYGYTNPGNPTRAAELAARDARLSHTANGIYAAMWAAALVSAAFTTENARTALEVAHRHIPPRSRLAIALAEVLADHRDGLGWEQATQAIHQRHDRYNWVHAIPNACLITAGLLWGAGDFTRTIARTVQSGCDTDSNGATAGSVAGILNGATAIPRHWTEPLHDTLHTAVFGYDGTSITALARRTHALALRSG
ncbi:ADP-ribosylglycohydrolase family protein [Nocardia sp. NPDC052566]|uniref:ADP-ribosylglycohydrolase family protein n=1 Tax=Nocardia sp. NPDC052566 TaxID=3364330 RepID=UPI0037CB8DE1